MTTCIQTDPSKRVARCKPWSSYCHNPVASHYTNTMTYSVIIKHHDAFSQSYLQGCEQSFDTEREAQDYIQTFEDWEQDLLEIDFNPF